MPDDYRIWSSLTGWRKLDDLALKTPGVHSILCKSEMVYIGQTCHSVESMVKEHNYDIQLYHPEEYVMCHHVLLNSTSILAKKYRQMDRIIREVIEMKLHPNNMNRKDGFFVSWSWKSLIYTHKEWKKFLSKNETILPLDLTFLFGGPEKVAFAFSPDPAFLSGGPKKVHFPVPCSC
jgi:hypothetical protein